MKKHILLILLLPLLLSCHHTTNTSNTLPADSVMHIHYAKGFRITYTPQYKTAEILSNDDGRVIHRYYLVHDNNTNTPTDGIKITIPLNAVATASTTYLLPLQQLGCLQHITGVCDGRLIYNPDVIQLLNEGKITDLGDSFSLNLERLMIAHPQALFMSVYNGGQNEAAQRVEKTGCPVIMNAEWKENHLLGRAEWIKYMAAFFDREPLADTLFNTIAANYNTLKNSVSTADLPKPKVLLNTPFKGTWYMPSGNSYISSILRDAGAEYIYQNDSTFESLPLSFEQVLHDLRDADVWIGVGAESIDEMLAIETRYQLFPVIHTGNIYNFHARCTPTGANDYWEGGVMHPDIILADFIKMLHPQLLPNHQLFYARKLTQHPQK